jgi:hypothetical protein
LDRFSLFEPDYRICRQSGQSGVFFPKKEKKFLVLIGGQEGWDFSILRIGFR